jgi:ferredoxin-NADP reductase
MQLLARNFPIIQREEVSENVIEVVCKQDGSFTFKPGQYVNISIEQLRYPDTKGKTRTFNLVSSPNNTEYLGFTFSKSNSGFKRTITEMPINSKIEFKGPFGVFTLPEDHSRPIVFIADGIGVTPCVSIALYAAEEKLPHKITMIYTSKKSHPYLENLKEAEGENPNFKLQSKIGQVDSGIIKKHVSNIKESRWYAAGTSQSVSHIVKTISQLGVLEKDIHIEEFSGY